MENDIPPNVSELIPITTQTPLEIEPYSEEIKRGNQDEPQSHENEFVNGDLDERDQRIKDLKKSNRMITYEVQLIWQKLKQQPEKTKIRRKLIEPSSNQQTLEKQLKNARHLIKIIEKEISRQRKKEKASKEMISKMKSIKKQLNERSDLSSSLKSDLATKTREVKELQKKIAFEASHNNSREFKAMADEMNHLFEVLSETEKREEEKMKTLKKQYEQVKKIQKNLIQKGIGESELELIKKRCIIEISPKKSDSFQSQNIDVTDNPKSRQKQERTQKKFNEMIHEIKILQKKQAGFQEEYKTSQNQRRNCRMKNVSMEQQLNRVEQEIQSLSELSEKLRSKHILRHRKRERLRSLELQRVEEEKQVQLKMKRQQFKNSHEKRTRRFKSLPSAAVNSEMKTEFKEGDIIKVQNKEEATTENTIFQKKEHKYGCGSQGANKFKDRYILGKEHLGKKITQLTLYFEPSSQFVSGISVGYDNGIKGGDYIWKTETNEDFYKMESYQCVNGFIRDIYPEFTSIEGKQRLTGVQIELNDGSLKTFGVVSRYESKLTEKEFVSSIFGVMSVITDERASFSAIEELGMEIYE